MVKAQDHITSIHKALAELVSMRVSDEHYELDVLPRDPVVDQVMVIRRAVDGISAILRADANKTPA